jgi:methyl-accepting chemotaxis protein
MPKVKSGHADSPVDWAETALVRSIVVHMQETQALERREAESMNQLTLKMKLGLGFGSLLLTLVAMGFVCYSSVGQLSDISARAEQIMTKTYLASQIEAALEKQTSAARAFMLAGRDDSLKYDEEGQQQFTESIDRLSPLLSTDEGRRLYGEIRNSYGDYRRLIVREIELRRADKGKDAIDLAFSPETAEVRNRVRKATDDMDHLQNRFKEQIMGEQNTAETRVRYKIVSLAVVGFAIGIGIALLISRSITTVIMGMVGLIQEIANNNLATADLEITSQDETGQAGEALNRMKNNLRQIIHSIASTATHVASASEEISASATQQAQSAETQKDQTTQVATSMQEMSSTVTQVSDNCNKAAEAARHAAETARQGGAIVEDTLTKMHMIAESVAATAKTVEGLGKSSDQIGHIIGVIDDIADQTNLLALNAAIEAARAGEQGRGFAVVADEVRKLAERTSAATKQIAQMVKGIQDETAAAVNAMEAGTKQAEEGVLSTAKAGDSLKAIILVSEQVGGMITEIATAATQQSATSEQVNNNVEQIAKLVKESALGAQQSATACQDLSGLALDLQAMVGKFNLGGSSLDNRGSSRSGSGPAAPGRARPSAFAAAAR